VLSMADAMPVIAETVSIAQLPTAASTSARDEMAQDKVMEAVQLAD